MSVPFRTRYTVADRIFDALCEHPYGLTIDQLVEVIYPNPDREPDRATDITRVRICYMNRRFKSGNLPFRVRPAGLKRYALFLRRVRA